MNWQARPEEVKRRLDAGETIFFLDVREPWESSLASLGGKLIPLGDLPHQLENLNPGSEMVVVCHHGVRSAQAVAFLRQKGFTKAINLQGGIDLWSRTVDPKVPRY
jgi:rhodanese-related sulfurtransferase